MHKLLQQFKEWLLANGDFYTSLLYLIALPIFSGEIISSGLAQQFGPYLSYLHIRITLHDILALAVLYFFLRKPNTLVNSALSRDTNKAARRRVMMIGLLLLLTILPSIFSQYILARSLSISPLMILLLPTVHLLSLLLNLSAFFISCRTVLLATVQNRVLFLKFLFIAIVLQLVICLGQLFLRGPILGSVMRWTGQPEVFTSKAIWGIYEFSRAYGTTPHPNILAAIGTFYAYLALSLHPPRKLLFALLFAISVMITTTLSKLGLIALAGVFVSYAFRSFFSRLSPSFSTVKIAPALFTLLALSLVVEWAAFTFQWSPPYFQSRAVIQQTYVELLVGNPFMLLTGTGFTLSIPTLLTHAPQLATSLVWGSRMLAEPPHNALLLLLVEFGAIGIGVGTVLVTRFLRLISLPSLENWEKIALLCLLAIWGGFDHLLIY